MTGSARGPRSAATAAQEIWQEPVRGGAVYPGLAVLSGVEQLQTFLTGQSPDPPAARLTGRRIVDASAGSVTYSLPATDWILGPKGFVHSGALALLADGALVAHGSSRCSVFPAIDDSVDLVAPSRPLPRSDLESPDPYRRSVPPTHRERLRPDRDGLELLRARAHGDLPPPPIDELVGIRLLSAEEARVVFAMPAHPWLSNEWGTVYGGATALLAKSAAAAAVQSTAPAGTEFTALGVKVNFLRAMPVDGRELVATGTLLHRGKRLAIGSAEVMHDGDRVAVATGTTSLTPPGRPGARAGQAAWRTTPSSSSSR